MEAGDAAEISAVTALQTLQYYVAHKLSNTSHSPLYLS
jgi:hypothetical protein